MSLAGRTAALAGAICLLATAAGAALPPAGVPSNAAASADSLNLSLQNKLRLVEHQLNQSPAALRIHQSQHAQANRMLTQARAHYAKAQDQAAAGRLPAAIEWLDEALRKIMAASKLVPDLAHLEALERNQNTQLREALGSFLVLQKSLADRTANKKVQTGSVVTEARRVDALVNQADALIASGNQRQANVFLKEAHRAVILALNDKLAAETIVYDLKFETPAEEFRYELARNLSYEELVPIALAQLNTTRSSATVAERHVQRSRELRAAANKQASTGAYPGAMKALQEATEQLQSALRVAGVLVPKSTEFTP